jgi:sugar lactone lactonase YvrE
MAKRQLELVLDAQAILGEGPLWDTQDQCLWWIDIEPGIVHRYDPALGRDDTCQAGQRVGTIVRRASGGIVLALETGIAACDWPIGPLQMLASPEAGIANHRFNDGKCDPSGRFWAGTLNYANEDLPEGTLYRLDHDLGISSQLAGICVSNGIVWTSDRRTMYYIDSPTRRVDAFDYDDASGTIGNRRTAIALPEGMGYPDGMTIDAEDNIWVALWSGWGVVRFNPRTGELLEKIEVPASQVTACALGGPELKDLYVTTARRGLDPLALTDQPLAGGLFRARVDVPGTPSIAFRG